MRHKKGRTVFLPNAIGRGLQRASIFAAVMVAAIAPAQEPGDFALRAVAELPASVQEVAVGSTYHLRVRLSSEIAGLEAWSFGLCVDTTQQEIVEAVPGEDLNRVFFGNPPEYSVIRTWTEAGAPQGVTQSVVLDLRGGSRIGAIPAEEAISVLKLELRPDAGTAGGEVTTTFCDTVGDPAVASLFVVGNVGTAPATQQGSSVSVVMDPPTLVAFTESKYNLALSIGSFTATTRVRSTFPLFGFSFGVAHDPALLHVEEPVVMTQKLVDDLGQEPEFVRVNVIPDSGFTAGVVFSLEPPGSDLLSLQHNQGNPTTPVFEATYTPGPQAADGISTELTFSNELGSPPVEVLFDLGDELVPETRGAAVEITQDILEIPFRRGDINGDGRYVISDPVLLLRVLFSGEQLDYDCNEALDANDDGDPENPRINVADAIYLLSYLFLSGPEPPAPFPDCGSITPNDPKYTGCQSYPACKR